MNRVIRDRDVNRHDSVTAQRRRDGGFARLPIRRVRHDDDVSGEFILVSIQEGSERRRTDLLLTLDENNNVDGQVRAEDGQRTQVDGHASAIVRGAAPVNTVAAHLSFVGIHAPTAQLTHRLHVVVGVQEDGRCSLNVGCVGDNGGLALRAILGRLAQDLRSQSQSLKTLPQMLGTALQVSRVSRVRRHRRNSDQLRELLQERRESSLEALP